MEWTFSGTIQVPFSAGLSSENRWLSPELVEIWHSKFGNVRVWQTAWVEGSTLRWSQQEEARVDDCSRFQHVTCNKPSANVSTFCLMLQFILKWFPHVPSILVTTSHLVLVWRSPSPTSHDTTDGWFDQPSVSTPSARSELSDGHLLPRSSHHVCQTGPGALVLGWDRRVYQVWTLLSWIIFFEHSKHVPKKT